MNYKERHDMRIAVIAGGSSSEREVSRASGENVQATLQEAGFGEVVLLDPAADDFIARIIGELFDAAFLALHGKGGEDGVIQGFLEQIGLPYTGSGVFASAVASDKATTKLLYQRAGLPTARDVVLYTTDSLDPAAIINTVGLPCFVKPADNGSSYGISLVKEAAELEGAIDLAFQYGSKVLVEQRLVGTEVTVGVFGNEEMRSLPIVEVCCEQEGSEFYDLAVKYIDPTRVHRIPARLNAADEARVGELAIRAHQALGCYGISRSDFIVTSEGPVILETNTIPGMTHTSLYPDEIAHCPDLEFPEVCAALIEMALTRSQK